MDFKALHFVIIIIVSTIFPTSAGYVLEALDTSSPCPIYLTISSTGHNVASSYLEINWGPKCYNTAEWIALYAKDPTISVEAPLFTVNTENQTTGHIKTNVKLGEINLPYGWNRDEIKYGHKPDHIKSACLPYFIASFNGKTIQTLDCLKIQPNWMRSIPQIQNVAFKELIIPGTHCSGCNHHRTKDSRSILIKKFGIVQNFDIWMQLVFGVRYLDISIGYKENTNNTNEFEHLWIVNENLFITPLRPILQDIRLFAVLSREIIIVNFIDFPIGFYQHPERHFELLRLLNTEFGDVAFLRPWDNDTNAGDLTIKTLDQNDKQIIILYNDKNVIEESQLIWPSWRMFTTVNLRKNELFDYIRKIFSKKFENSPKTEPWIIYGIQGVNVSYMPGSHLPSSRDRANSINKVFTDTITGAWAKNANVIAFDFFMSCNLIDLTIGANIQKHFNNTNYLIIDINA